MPCSMALISLRCSSASWARSGSSMASSSPNKQGLVERCQTLGLT